MVSGEIECALCVRHSATSSGPPASDCRLRPGSSAGRSDLVPDGDAQTRSHADRTRSDRVSCRRKSGDRHPRVRSQSTRSAGTPAVAVARDGGRTLRPALYPRPRSQSRWIRLPELPPRTRHSHAHPLRVRRMRSRASTPAGWLAAQLFDLARRSCESTPTQPQHRERASGDRVIARSAQ